MTVFFIVLRQICMMALLIAVGWFLARKGILTKDGNAQLSFILTSVIVPSVIFCAFLSLDASLDGLQQLGTTFALCFGSFLFAMLVAVLLARKGDRDAQAVTRTGLVFTNNGFFGIPLSQALFGEIGVFYASINVLCANLLMWTWGYAQYGVGQRGVKGMLRQPTVAAGLLGLAVFLLRLCPLTAPLFAAAWFTAVTQPLNSALETLKSMNTPVAMLILGVNVYNAGWKPDRRILRDVPVMALRQILIPLAWLALTVWLPTERTLIFSVFLEATCPVALMISVLSARSNASPAQQERSTRLVVLSTLSALVTVPLMVALGDLICPLG